MESGCAAFGLVVPLFGMGGAFSRLAYLEALQRFPNLALLLVGHPGDEVAARELLERYPSRVEALLQPRLTESSAIQHGMKLLLSRALPFVGYWGADAEVPIEFANDWQTRFAASNAILVFGSRLRLVQHRHPALWQRHYSGRVLASAVSFALGLQIYDTECCAKLFRNTARIRGVFHEPFETKVCFNAEMFARLATGRDDSSDLARDCLEIPLERWSARTRPRYGFVHIAERAADLVLLSKKVRQSHGS